MNRSFPRTPWILLTCCVALGLHGRVLAQDVGVGVGVSSGNAAASFQVLTSGPVHETFASPVLFDTSAIAFIVTDPPPIINEIPPLEKPAGFVEWVPGYWSFDDDRRTWIWVTGTWRIPPPGYTWVEGYWTKTSRGWRYVAGYWAPATIDAEIDYLPAPPATLEAGPIGIAPWADAIWAPGTWVWVGSNYAWRDGYWVQPRPEWVWVPAEYVWTPSGFVFVESHWDFPLERRGFLYAPIVFNPGASLTASLAFTPSFAINVTLFNEGFFASPRHRQYYFGDYYAKTWWDRGVYPAFSFHLSRFGYDPLFAYASWRFGRSDPRWIEERRLRFQNLRENEAARPPRTLDEQARRPATPEAPAQTQAVAVAVRDIGPQMTPLRIERAKDTERDNLVARVKERQQAREARVKMELQDGAPDGKAPEQPRKMKLTKTIAPQAEEAAKAAGNVPEKPRIPKPEPERQAPPRGDQASKLPEPSPDRASDHLGRGADRAANGNRPDRRPEAEKPKPQPQPKPDETPQPPPVRRPEAEKPKPQPQPKPDETPQPPPVRRPEAEKPKPQPQPKPDETPQPPPVRRPEAEKPEPPQPKPEAKPQPAPARRPDAGKPAPQPPPVRRPEAEKPQPQPKPDAKPQPAPARRPDAGKPAPQPPQPKPDGKPEPKPAPERPKEPESRPSEQPLPE